MSGLRAEDTYIFGRGYGSDTIDENGDFSSISADSIFDHVKFLAGVAPEDVQLVAYRQRSRHHDRRNHGPAHDQEPVRFDQLVLQRRPRRTFRFRQRHDLDRRGHRPASAAGAVHRRQRHHPGLRRQRDPRRARPATTRMTGLIGEDVYLFGRGSGADTIDDNGNFSSVSADDIFDRLQFKQDVALTDLTFARNGNDLIIGIVGTGDQITIKNQLEFTIIVLEQGSHRALRLRRRHDSHRRRHGPAPAARRGERRQRQHRGIRRQRDARGIRRQRFPVRPHRRGHLHLRPRLRSGHHRGER